jgi:hypothetical protein
LSTIFVRSFQKFPIFRFLAQGVPFIFCVMKFIFCDVTVIFHDMAVSRRGSAVVFRGVVFFIVLLARCVVQLALYGMQSVSVNRLLCKVVAYINIFKVKMSYSVYTKMYLYNLLVFPPFLD